MLRSLETVKRRSVGKFCGLQRKKDIAFYNSFTSLEKESFIWSYSNVGELNNHGLY